MLDDLIIEVKTKIEEGDIDNAIRAIKSFRSRKNLQVRYNHFANTIISCTGFGKCISDLRKY